MLVMVIVAENMILLPEVRAATVSYRVGGDLSRPSLRPLLTGGATAVILRPPPTTWRCDTPQKGPAMLFPICRSTALAACAGGRGEVVR